MRAFSDHVFAVRLGFGELSRGKFWLYLLPAVVVTFVFYGMFSFIHMLADGAHVADDVPLVGEYITKGVIGFFDLLAMITDEIYKFFILTLLSPVNCLLSEKVDNTLTNARFSGGIVRILNDLLRAVFIVVFAILMNFACMLFWWMFAWITGFHAIDTVMYFLINAFFIGFSFYDFSLERYGIGFFGTLGFGFGNMSYMLITGALFSLVYMIPVVGLIVSPFLLTIFSTIVYLKMKGKIPVSEPDTIPE